MSNIDQDDLRRQLPDSVVDELLAGARTEEEIVGPGGLLSQLTRRLVERALTAWNGGTVGHELALRPGFSTQARMPPTARSAPRGVRRGLLVLTAGLVPYFYRR